MNEIVHEFIFQPGEWLGKGTVSFSTSSEQMQFYTAWKIKKNEDSKIECTQIVEMQGLDEHIVNTLIIFDISASSFKVDLKNEMLKSVQGKGIINLKKIAWEFCDKGIFEGFEIYELTENGEYIFHAEYASTEQFKTIINGKIWRKTT